MGRRSEGNARQSVGIPGRKTGRAARRNDAKRGVAKRPLDPQAGRVYNWENQHRTIRVGAPLTPGRLHRLVRAIAKHYRIPKPQLRSVAFADRTTLAQAAGAHTIEFSAHQPTWTPLIVAHEMAHIIQTHYGMYPRHSAHGRQFAGILLYILHKFKIMPAQAAMPSMSFAKVRYYHPHHCRPAGIRNWYKRNERSRKGSWKSRRSRN